MDKEIFNQYLDKYIHLLGLYLNKKTSDESIDDKELSFFVNLSKRHSLTALLYKALKDTSVNVNKEYLNKLEQYYLANLRKSVLFENERKELYKYLNDNQIDFLPLKGIIIKNYYLDPYTREFADNDILFKDKDELVKKFFTDKKYEVESFKKSNHDVYLKKPCYNFEMHRALFGESIKSDKVVKYYNDIMERASIKEEYEHVLSSEDFYIYLTAHSYKHFHNAGCGIRTLVDYYFFLKNNQLDFDYVNKELEKLDLLEFSNMISALSKKLFDEQELNEQEKETLLFIASAGTYGSLENAVNRGVKEKGKFRYFMSRIFPPMSVYKSLYPWAYKTKVLIPVAWLVRAFRILFKNPKRAATELKMISKSDAKKEEKNND